MKLHFLFHKFGSLLVESRIPIDIQVVREIGWRINCFESYRCHNITDISNRSIRKLALWGTQISDRFLFNISTHLANYMTQPMPTSEKQGRNIHHFNTQLTGIFQVFFFDSKESRENRTCGRNIDTELWRNLYFWLDGRQYLFKTCKISRWCPN